MNAATILFSVKHHYFIRIITLLTIKVIYQYFVQINFKNI